MSSIISDTPQPHPPHFTQVFYDDDHLVLLDGSSSNPSHTSSPESRPADPSIPIPEEDEDETSSEAAEPITPVDHQNPQSFADNIHAIKESHMDGTIHKRVPLILNTSASPPPPAHKQDLSATPVTGTPKTPTARRAGSSSANGKGIRSVSGFFRRSNSQTGPLLVRPELMTNGSDPMFGPNQRKMSATSKPTSATESPMTSRSNTPNTPSSPKSSTEQESPNESKHLSVQEPSKNEFFHNRKKNRSTTGFSIFDKLSRNKKSPVEEGEHGRNRSTSVELGSHQAYLEQSEVQHISRQPWGMAAETGAGLKSRRLSLSLPNVFDVGVIELYDEYSDQSKLIGRRGKSVGKGATANVRLMLKKGCSSETYAVKEFRGKSSHEKEADYEKKVKSEFSIAKSAHHPNIVQTYHLGTHNGHWNHVMEFCDQGDLFSLVNQKYLDKEKHAVDRLCLFKQLIQGLNYLHNNGIAHRDIKLENLLITKESKLKITDFGVSEVFCGIHPGLNSAGGQCGKEMNEIRLCAPGMCGSPPYVAPEVVAKKGPYDPRPLDVWGAAIVMLCMCAGGCLWEKAEAGSSPLYDDLVKGWVKWNAKHSHESNCSITESDYPHVSFFDKHINPPALRRLLLVMLNPDPAKRVTMAEVANNRWIKTVECCQVDSYEDPTEIIDASKASTCNRKKNKVVLHNHLAPVKHHGHHLVRLPGSTDMH